MVAALYPCVASVIQFYFTFVWCCFCGGEIVPLVLEAIYWRWHAVLFKIVKSSFQGATLNTWQCLLSVTHFDYAFVSLSLYLPPNISYLQTMRLWKVYIQASVIKHRVFLRDSNLPCSYILYLSFHHCKGIKLIGPELPMHL